MKDVRNLFRLKKETNNNAIKGATKFYFTHHLCGVIILFNTDLNKSAFSTYSFGKLVFCLFVFLFYLNNFNFVNYFNFIKFI